MTRLRYIQIGLALCLMASMLTANPAACVCSHHDEVTESEDCHSHQQNSENTELAETGISFDDDSCICAAEQRSPSLVSKIEGKDVKSEKDVANAPQPIPDLEFVAVRAVRRTSSESLNVLSYSSTLNSLLPSRAPPRL